jgi:hypothetical protein
MRWVWLLLLVPSVASAKPEETLSDAGYQNTRWGMSITEVQKLNPDVKSAKWNTLKALEARRLVSELKAQIDYVFKDGRLEMVRVTFMEPRSSGERLQKEEQQKGL